MKTVKANIPNHHRKRLDAIAQMLKEMRFAEGKCQDELIEHGLTRRQVQRGETVGGGQNLTLQTLFRLIDAYNYTLHDFFEGME